MQSSKFYFLLLSFIISSVVASELPSDEEKALVFSKAGNIYYRPLPAVTLQITHSTKDSVPVLSLGKKLIAFIRIGNQTIPKGCEGNTETHYGNQIWIYNITTKKERLLVANSFYCDKPEKKIIDPSDLVFSPDSKILYFLTSAWTTSRALHGINISGAHQHYIAPANSVEVIPAGKYKGYFIINQHRYFIPPGGSYDWYWLIKPNGKDEGPLGEEITDEQRNFLNS